MKRQDNKIVLNRGLTVDSEAKCAHDTGCKNDSSLFESVDNKQMVRNVCFSSEKYPMNLFLTFTCNQKEHFGVEYMKLWVDNEN